MYPSIAYLPSLAQGKSKAHCNDKDLRAQAELDTHC